MPHEIDEHGNIVRRRGRPSKQELAELARLQAAEPQPRGLSADAPRRPRRPQTPAADRLKEMEEQRRRNGGFLVPPPLPAEELAKAAPVLQKTKTGTEIPGDNAQMRAMRDWLIAIDKAGGFWGDLQNAWRHWEPIYPRHKYHLLSLLDGMRLPAERRECELRRQAEAEMHPWRAKMHARRGVAEARKRVEELRAELAKAEAALEASIEAERQIDETWDLSSAPEAA